MYEVWSRKKKIPHTVGKGLIDQLVSYRNSGDDTTPPITVGGSTDGSSYGGPGNNRPKL